MCEASACRFCRRRCDHRPDRLAARQPVLIAAQPLLTLAIVGLLVLVLPPLIRFLFIDAIWSGTDREACLGGPNGEVGACWAFVRERLSYFIYGSYPIA